MDEATKDIIQKLSESLNNIDSRLRAIESNSVAQTQPSPPAEATGVVDEDVDLNTAFSAVKAAVQHIKLPSSLQVPTDKTGVRRSDQPLLNLITKVAKYAETGLKIIQTPLHSDTSAKLQDLLTTLSALVQLLQEEHAAVVVQGTFDDNVAKFFRTLQRSSGFNQEALENLRAAASIASVYRPQRRGQANGYQGGRGQGGQYQQRGAFRGRRGFSGRGHQFQSQQQQNDLSTP